MKRYDLEYLKNYLTESFDTALDGRVYYPSRTRYLNSVLATIDNLDSDKKYAFLCLSASFGFSRVSSTHGYSHSAYFKKFADRSRDGDVVLRTFSIPSLKHSYSEEFEDLRDYVVSTGLEECFNVYSPATLDFNCAYIVPLSQNAPEELFANYRQRKYLSNQTHRKEFIQCLKRNFLQDEAIIFYEIADYNEVETLGVGFKTYVGRSSNGSKKKLIGSYMNIFSAGVPLAHPPELGRVDRFGLGIIVVTDEEERAVKRQFGAEIRRFESERCIQGFSYSCGILKEDDSEKYATVLVVNIGDAGNVGSATAAANLVQSFGVKKLLSVGIAGGDKNHVRRGDIVIAKRVVYYEKEKIKKGNSENESDYRTYVRNFPGVTEVDISVVRDRIAVSKPTEEDGLTTNDAARKEIHTDVAFASGEKLVNDDNFFKKMRKIDRKVVAAENEAAGVYFVGNTHSVEYVSVKAISDYADKNKNDKWHSYATEAAAAFAIELIRKSSLNR